MINLQNVYTLNNSFYFDNSNVLQYFGNVRYNSAAPDTFAEVV